ncbi:MAG: response regulator [Lentisphaerae bacterium]|jgi:two-component system, cell cycle sensor histidine kinase and response regulator CckA|nr:response regulator [Lentisphaerota bacterium]MBT4819888.1 response regulator [Lentisphaerota bacterium]MBT5608191.1 response regulator [Lentisphaerota bacterium]MBT7058920.1 response regulator [Lentisphaerota bacterium]MBT7842849.1 response regulator [Lentisphaerota bacterium]
MSNTTYSVLVVQQGLGDVDQLCDLLRELDCSVRVVADAEAAIACASDVDVVMIDRAVPACLPSNLPCLYVTTGPGAPSRHGAYTGLVLPADEEQVRAALRCASHCGRPDDERRRIEGRVRQLDKLESLGVMAGGIAHDFNNLLMGILGNADLALRELAPVSPARDMIKDIRRSAQSAADLCKQMLAYSGKGQFVVRTVDLNELIRGMMHLLASSVPQKNTICYELGQDMPPVDVDMTQMRQIIMNLVTNAAEALQGSSGRIFLSTGVKECDRDFFLTTHLAEEKPSGAYVCLEVKDTGQGIEPRAFERIFDPFYTTKFIGRGLGLPAVLGVVRGHGGAIRVNSEPGQGTTITVLLPRSENELPEPPLKSPGMGALTQTGTVLVVDDEELVRTVTRRLLERIGFSVLCAADGIEAIEVFRKHRDEIALIMLDLTMPRMNGNEAYAKIREMDPAIPVVLASGYDAVQAAERFDADGLSGFVQKPYRAKELEAVLRAALEA